MPCGIGGPRTCFDFDDFNLLVKFHTEKKCEEKFQKNTKHELFGSKRNKSTAIEFFVQAWNQAKVYIGFCADS